MELMGRLSLKCVVCLKFCKIFRMYFCCYFRFASRRFTDKKLQMANSNSFDGQIRAKFELLVHGYRRMFDHSLSKSKDLGDMLRLLPGVVVQNPMSMQGMADLYRIKPDLLERLVKSTIEPLESAPLSQSPLSHYIFDGYLFDFLLDRDRSRVYYCAPMLQHIHICRHFFSLLDGDFLSERSWVFRLI